MAKAKFKYGDRVNWPNCAYLGPLQVLYALHASKPDARISFGGDSERTDNKFIDQFVYVLFALKDKSVHVVGESKLMPEGWQKVDGDYKQVNGQWFKRVGG